jgi:4'-phosphopantetheinyl transferase EntD
MDAALLEHWCTGVCPSNTAVAAASITQLPAFDLGEEAVLSRAAPRRRDEFRSGRRCARRALLKLDCPPQGIPTDERRLPVWPSGFLGSISHGAGLCIAQVGRSVDFLGIGVDVEAADAVTPDLHEAVVTADEWKVVSSGGPGDWAAATLSFSAKEAFYKAYFPVTGVLLDFHDVWLEVDWSCSRFTATLVPPDKPGMGGRRSWTGHFLLSGLAIASTILIDRAAQG